MTQKPFLIVGLPRSRTAWLANYFTYGGIHCYHDLLLEVDATKLLKNIAPYNGVADSALCLFPELVLNAESTGQVNILVVDRNINESLSSLRVAMDTENINGDPDNIITVAMYGFEQIKRFTKGMVVNFYDIDNSIRDIHKHLTPTIPFNQHRHELLRHMKVTQMIKNRISYASLTLNNKRSKLPTHAKGDEWVSLPKVL